MTDDTDTIEEPTAVAPPPSRPPLTRPVEGKVLGGVAAGIARHFGWDPLLVRIGFVLLCFLGGAGAIAYVAGWVMLPRDTDADARDHRTATDLQHRGIAFWIGVGLLVLAAIALLGDTGLLGAGVPVAIALVAVGIALWRSGERAATSAPAGATVSTADTPSPAVGAGGVDVAASGDASAATGDASAEAGDALAEAGDALADTVPGGTVPPLQPPIPSAPAPPSAPTPPGPSRPKSYLGRLTVALALIATAVTIGLERAGAIEPTAVQVIAVPLLVIAGGLLVGAWVGRARWLILPALGLTLMLPVAAVTSELDVDFSSGIGERRVVIDDPSDAGEHRLGIGSMWLDLDEALQALDGAGELHLDVSVGLGEIVIDLPDDPDVGYRIMATVRWGEVRGADRAFAGDRVSETFVRPARSGAGTVVVEAFVSAGQIDLVD